MTTEPADSKEITPPELIPAIDHIRRSFETGVWKCTEVTYRLAYAALHPEKRDPKSLLPFEAAFVVYRTIVGPAAEKHFDELFRAGTPPSFFRAYFDSCLEGIEVEARKQFSEVLQIAIANAEVLGTNPVEWTRSQLLALVRG